MIDLESKFEVLEAEVKEINANKETLKRNLLDLIELQHILQKTQTFFMEVRLSSLDVKNSFFDMYIVCITCDFKLRQCSYLYMYTCTCTFYVCHCLTDCDDDTPVSVTTCLVVYTQCTRKSLHCQYSHMTTVRSCTCHEYYNIWCTVHVCVPYSYHALCYVHVLVHLVNKSPLL